MIENVIFWVMLGLVAITAMICLTVLALRDKIHVNPKREPFDTDDWLGNFRWTSERTTYARNQEESDQGRGPGTPQEPDQEAR